MLEADSCSDGQSEKSSNDSSDTIKSQLPHAYSASMLPENTKVVLITNSNVDCHIDRVEVVPDATGRTFNVFLKMLNNTDDSSKSNFSDSQTQDAIESSWQKINGSKKFQASLEEVVGKIFLSDHKKPSAEMDSDTNRPSNSSADNSGEELHWRHIKTKRSTDVKSATKRLSHSSAGSSGQERSHCRQRDHFPTEIPDRVLNHNPTRRLRELAHPRMDCCRNHHSHRVSDITRQALTYSATPRIVQLAQPVGEKTIPFKFRTSNDMIPQRVLQYTATPRIIQLAQPRTVSTECCELADSVPRKRRKMPSSKTVHVQETIPEQDEDAPKIVQRQLPKEMKNQSVQDDRATISKMSLISNRKFIAFMKNRYKRSK